MLNELQVLRRSLSERGIQTQAWHRWSKTFKKGDAVAAELDTIGHLARISLLSTEEVAGLRNIVQDNFNSFPGFNLNCPCSNSKMALCGINQMRFGIARWRSHHSRPSLMKRRISADWNVCLETFR